MAWAASHLYLQPADGVLPRLLARPELVRGVYYLTELSGHRWPTGRRHRHELPPGGLMVVREIDRGDAEHAGTVVDFGSLAPDTPGDDVPLVDLVLGGAGPVALNPYLTADVRLLRYLKWLGRETGAVTAHYWASSWGGGFGWHEGGWVLGPEDCRYELDSEQTVLERRAAGARAIAGRAVIQLVLAHFGLNLPTSYCAWLTRGFDWARHRLPSHGPTE